MVVVILIYYNTTNGRDIKMGSGRVLFEGGVSENHILNYVGI